MKRTDQDSAQAMQRVRVGMTGLGVVLAMIGVGSMIFASANTDATGAAEVPQTQAVANMSDPIADGDTAEEKQPDEPLAELGVAPSAVTTDSASANKIAAQIAAEKQKDSLKVH